MDAKETRQFACGGCKKKWWKEVSALNPVCKCYTCGDVLKAIPRDKEYGVGLHECGCGHVFHGRTRVGVPSPCYKCGEDCLPKIIPNKAGVNKKSDNVHKCATCGGRGDCVQFNEIIHTSTVVGHASVDDDDYGPDEGDNGEDWFDNDDYVPYDDVEDGCDYDEDYHGFEDWYEDDEEDPSDYWID